MDSDPPRFGSLLSPQDCGVLLIDWPADDPESGSMRERQALCAALLVAAHIHRVPLLRIVRKGDRKTQDCAVIPEGDHVVRQWPNPFEDAAVRHAVARLDRRRLLIAGGRGDTDLCFTVLSALEEGFEIYLLRDLSWGSGKRAFKLAVARMLQAGAVPVSVGQVISEWQRGLIEQRARSAQASGSSPDPEWLFCGKPNAWSH